MVGRAAQGAPWIFAEINRALGQGSQLSGVDTGDWNFRQQIILGHLELMVAAKGQERGVLEMRKHLGWYLRGLPGAARKRQELMQARIPSQVEEILRSIVPGVYPLRASTG